MTLRSYVEKTGISKCKFYSASNLIKNNKTQIKNGLQMYADDNDH